jgi:hypothetical protein
MNFRGGKYVDRGLELAKQFRYRSYRALERLGFLVRKQAQSSIEDEPGPSEPDHPPHTHKRATSKSGRPRKQGLLPASILYGLDKASMSVLIGPSKNVVGTVGQAFEHEGETTYKGQHYPSRSFMGPALGEEIGELPGLLSEEWGKV